MTQPGAMTQASPEKDPLLTPGEVAALLRVDPKTVGRWATKGLIRSVRTPGGHRRYRESWVEELLEASQEGPPADMEQVGPTGELPGEVLKPLEEESSQ